MSTRLLKRRVGPLHVEAVMTYPDRRKVNYYRYAEVAGGPAVGSVSEKPEGWRALMYGPNPKQPHDGRYDIGMFSNRDAAESALLDEYRRVMSGTRVCPQCHRPKIVVGESFPFCPHCIHDEPNG